MTPDVPPHETSPGARPVVAVKQSNWAGERTWPHEVNFRGFMKILFAAIRTGLFCGAFVLALISGLGELGRFFPLLDTLNHFRPFTMVAAIALLAIAVLAYPRPLRRQPAIWLILSTVAVQGLSLGPEFAHSALSRAMASPHPVLRSDVLRIATFNVWGRNNRQQEAADALVRLDPDVIVLQEAWRGQEALVTLLKKTHPHTSDCIAVSLCNVAVLSRTPLKHSKVYRPDFQRFDKWTVPIVRADLSVSKGQQTFETIVFATHLTWPTQVPLQRNQMDQLADIVRNADLPNVILVGDFNSTPWSFGLAYLGDLLTLKRVTHALPTWPAALAPRIQRLFREVLAGFGLKPRPLYAPFLPIDHAFVGDALEARSVSRAQIPGSDHYAIVLDIAPHHAGAGN